MGFTDELNGHISLKDVFRRNPALIKGIVAVFIIACLFVVYGFVNSSPSSGIEVQKADQQEEVEEVADETPQSAPLICVHVAGCVLNPGICYLEEGSRVCDAIDACGGFSEEAATDSLNLARVIEDGEQIIVADINEITSIQSDIEGADEAIQGTSAVASGMQSQGKVNINTATSSELQTLSGIGASKAEKIIAYRQSNGNFKSVDDLTNVSGIGEKTLESIRESICV